MLEIKDVTNDHALFVKSRKNVHAQWGTHLKFEDYVKLEETLAKTLRENKLEFRVHALVDDEMVIGSCDVITRPLYHAQDKYTHDSCIGKVFVLPEHRQKGYASTLLKKVTAIYNVRSNKVSLWSDIGDFYCRFGYEFPLTVPGESYVPRWNIKNPRNVIQEGCEALNANATKTQIVNEHQRLAKRLTDTLQEECGGGDVRFTHVVPHEGLYDRMIQRAINTARLLHLKEPEFFSARTTDGHGWLTWSYFFEEHKVCILSAYGSANDISTLLITATKHASEYGCHVELWESSIINLEIASDEIVSAVAANKLTVEYAPATEALPMSVGPGIWLRPGFYAWS